MFVKYNNLDFSQCNEVNGRPCSISKSIAYPRIKIEELSKTYHLDLSKGFLLKDILVCRSANREIFILKKVLEICG